MQGVETNVEALCSAAGGWPRVLTFMFSFHVS